MNEREATDVMELIRLLKQHAEVALWRAWHVSWRSLMLLTCASSIVHRVRC
jgi:hypothetical protein